MFQPQPMSQIELVVPENDVVPVTEALADLGVLHQINASYLGVRDSAHPVEYWDERVATFTALERRILNVMQTLGISEAELPKSAEAVHTIEPDTVNTALVNLESEVQKCVVELETQRKELERLQGYVRQLQPLENLNVEIESLRSLRYTFLILGTIPVHNLERLRTSLTHVPSVLLTLRREDHLAVVALFGSKSDSEVLQRAARSAYLNSIDLSESYHGTFAQINEALDAGMDRAEQNMARCEMDIDRLHQARVSQLQDLLWRVRASRVVSQAIAQFGWLHYTYLILGWVPTDQIERIRHELQRVSDKVMIEVREPDSQEAEADVPTVLSHPSFMQGFQQLVTNYGAPRYREIDPTLLLMLTFPLMFGIMFGDVGHGLMLIALALTLASGRLRALKQMQGLGWLVAGCGLTSIVFGFLYGSVFGLEDLLRPLWLRPLENITDVMLVSVAFGVVLLNVGFGCNLVNAWLAGDWQRLLFSPSGLSGIALYWSLIGLIARAFLRDFPIGSSALLTTALLGGLAIVLGAPLGRLVRRTRPILEEGTGTYVVQALFELFETVISLMSNSLSYVRVGAFAVAHGGLTAVVFILAEMVSPSRGLSYWLVVTLGNLVVVGFEGLIVGIQTMRLEYYEFFSKFFTGGGVHYRPLTLSRPVRE